MHQHKIIIALKNNCPETLKNNMKKLITPTIALFIAVAFSCYKAKDTATTITTPTLSSATLLPLRLPIIGLPNLQLLPLVY